ncbi:sugar ABC transporter permease [Rhizobium leguminosarum]|uniref:carbohydrate ABC transporter permease n=1 Tax=Rhizobium leguminosarum TaxID=384 RepID=UPI001C96FB02|nr:sugar ABC transporter permease [Rhizobium leguminosarum]MBY5766976.1 sugar ABC transporter permease [Rhizobium leguminosarum]
MSIVTHLGSGIAMPERTLRERLSSAMPVIILTPSLIASFTYVFLFAGWTFYISLSDSTLLPSYGFVGLKNYISLWANRRWDVAYNNLFLFSIFYVLSCMAFGLFLAILIDQKVRAESLWRSIFLYPMATSFMVTGAVWSWLYNPTNGIEFLVRNLGWQGFQFALTSNKDTAMIAIIATGIWQSSGFAMALFLAGLRSVDGDIVKAAQIDGASTLRIYRKVVLPAMAPIFAAVAVVLLQFAIKTFELSVALTNSGPGIATTFPATFVYDMMYARGEIGQGAAASIMILIALAAVLVPYALFAAWQGRKGGRRD